jgi:hypothetical protein
MIFRYLSRGSLVLNTLWRFEVLKNMNEKDKALLHKAAIVSRIFIVVALVAAAWVTYNRGAGGDAPNDQVESPTHQVERAPREAEIRIEAK